MGEWTSRYNPRICFLSEFLLAMKMHVVLVLTALAISSQDGTAADSASRPLRVLLITGGCCHDYARQKDLLKKGLEARAHVRVDQFHSDDRSTRARFPIYRKLDWADGYDAVIHDECSPDVKDLSYVRNILEAHRKVPAVNLHCAMHSYRTGTDDWIKFVGIQSTSHGPQAPIAVHYAGADHPVTNGLGSWTATRDELYNNVRVLDTTRALAWGGQTVEDRNGVKRVEESVVAWVSEHGDTRVFSTTLGHSNETVADDRYLDLVTRGLLWAVGKLDPRYLRTPGAARKP